eukprot:scaffold13244_cov37-Attheya_sp.AAC.1
MFSPDCPEVSSEVGSKGKGFSPEFGSKGKGFSPEFGSKGKGFSPEDGSVTKGAVTKFSPGSCAIIGSGSVTEPDDGAGVGEIRVVGTEKYF